MKNIIGKKFGKWTVVSRDTTQKGKYKLWCQCSCGSPIKSLWYSAVTMEKTTSCGCEKPTRRMRPVKLKNAYTGKVIAANSISEFCKLANLDNNDKYHITPILDGERLHHKGWHIPELTESRKTVFVDIYGNEYPCHDFILFAKTHRQKISGANISVTKLKALIDGEITSHYGFYVKGRKHVFDTRSLFKRECVFDNGVVRAIGTNLVKMGKKLKLCRSGLCKVATGKAHQHRGWTLTAVNLIPKYDRMLTQHAPKQRF